MTDQPTDDPDVDLDREDLRDRHGNRVTREYVERALADIVDEDTPVVPSDVPHHFRAQLWSHAHRRAGLTCLQALSRASLSRAFADDLLR